MYNNKSWQEEEIAFTKELQMPYSCTFHNEVWLPNVSD